MIQLLHCFSFSIIVLFFAVFTGVFAVYYGSIYSSPLQLTFAQIIGTTEDTFSAKGSISSLVTSANQSITTNSTAINSTTAPTANSTAINSTTAPTANSTAATTTAIPIPYRLTGTWHLNVTSGNVTNFKAKFVMSHLNPDNLTANKANLSRAYEITNFQGDRDKFVQLNGDGTAFIVGGAHVKSTNGIDNWKNVETVLIIDRLNTMKIVLDSNATANHFKSIILGKVDSIKDHNGREMKTNIGAFAPTGNMTNSLGAQSGIPPSPPAGTAPGTSPRANPIIPTAPAPAPNLPR
jgi:hypothetical protein